VLFHKVLIVDDYEPFRRFLRLALEERRELLVIGECADGLEAVQRSANLQPDLILLDIGLPSLNGIDVAKQIRKFLPNSKIVFISQESSPDVVQKALSLGIAKYVQKTRAGSELLRVIEDLLDDDAFNNQKYQKGAPTVRHEVQFYSDEEPFLETLSHDIHGSLKAGNAAVIFATEAHRCALDCRLQSLDLDTSEVKAQGRYVSFDAAETLNQIVTNGTLDSNKFMRLMEPVIVKANDSLPTDETCVTVFGEIVALLWARGDRDEAIRLEQFWNELLSTHRFSLLCAYPMSAAERIGQGQSLTRVCATHSAVYHQHSSIGDTAL
jgi:YesN/AraC family two-component response regulator